MAESFKSNDPLLTRGAQTVAGGRVTCAECGLRVIRKRDERAAARAALAERATKSVADVRQELSQLVAKRRNLLADIGSLEKRASGLFGRIKFLFTGKLL